MAAKNPTAYAYDALDRVREVCFPHGAVTRVDYGFGALAGVDMNRGQKRRLRPQYIQAGNDAKRRRQNP